MKMSPLGVNLSTVEVEFGVCIIDGNLSVERFNELHFCPSEAEALRLGRDLETASIPLHNIVIADAAFVVKAAGAVQIFGSGTPGFFRIARSATEAAVVVGGTVFIIAALNCSPCSLSLTHQPSATSHSPAVTAGNDPTTVISSLCPCALTRRTQKPLSSLWKVTRSIRPEISSVVGLRSGVAAFMCKLIFTRMLHIAAEDRDCWTVGCSSEMRATVPA
jgi:hypothetical protein